MMGNISKLVLFFCLVLTVTDSALVRMKRQQSGGEANPVSPCKDMRVPHGGIKLYPVESDHHHPADDTCYIHAHRLCEFRFYCDEHYESVGHQEIRCVTHDTGESEFIGTFPTCQPIRDNNYGCRDTYIPHGGIKLFPNSMETIDPLRSCDVKYIYCEPKLYCDEGYEDTGSRQIYCGTNKETGGNEYKYVGDSPVCEGKMQPDSNQPGRDLDKYGDGPSRPRYHVYYVGFIPVTIVVIIISVVIRALRIKYRYGRSGRIIRTTTMDITPEYAVPNGHSTGGPPYARFDDSHIQVPRDQSTPDIQVKEVQD